MQRNNEEMQQAMLAIQEENALLREYLADLEQEAQCNSSKHPIPQSLNNLMEK